jgi:hypothetical protein
LQGQIVLTEPLWIVWILTAAMAADKMGLVPITSPLFILEGYRYETYIEVMNCLMFTNLSILFQGLRSATSHFLCANFSYLVFVPKDIYLKSSSLEKEPCRLHRQLLSACG